MNYVHLIGTILTEPRLDCQRGGHTASFTMQTEEEYWDEQGEKRFAKTSHFAHASGRLADAILEYGEKDQRISVSGRLATRFFRDASGRAWPRTSVEILEPTIFNLNDATDETIK